MFYIKSIMQNAVNAKWWSIYDNKIRCELCPRYCLIGEGQPGFCYIRHNENGKLKTGGWERSTGIALDPIEKKPLYHVYPGKSILSLGTAGCNMGCRFCQNWEISKAALDNKFSIKYKTSEIIDEALALKDSSGNAGLAFTYNEPTIWAEWAYELAVYAKYHGLISVMVTNGYITKQAVKDIYHAIDAANIDLKSFSEKFYYRTTFSHLKPVLDAILWIKNEDTWIELTTLLIPGHNDSLKEIKELCRWVKEFCGDETPLHFTAFRPDYKMNHVPSTNFAALKKAFDIGKETGLKYVYTGNVPDEHTNSTYCPNCSNLLISRKWYRVNSSGLNYNFCKKCGFEIHGIF